MRATWEVGGNPKQEAEAPLRVKVEPEEEQGGLRKGANLVQCL